MRWKKVIRLRERGLDTIEVKPSLYAFKRKGEMYQDNSTIDLSSIVKNEQQLTAYVPNATIRYRMQGSGVNFVHGGASLQEIVVPLSFIQK